GGLRVGREERLLKQTASPSLLAFRGVSTKEECGIFSRPGRRTVSRAGVRPPRLRLSLVQQTVCDPAGARGQADSLQTVRVGWQSLTTADKVRRNACPRRREGRKPTGGAMRNARPTTGVLAGCVLFLGAAGGLAQDWPQWRGPNRDAKAIGFTAPKTWPKELTQK